MELLHPLYAGYVEELARQFRADPASVDTSWRTFFEGEGRDLLEGPLDDAGPSFQPHSIFHGRPTVQPASPKQVSLAAQLRIAQLINAYRRVGHLKAALDPLGLAERRAPSELTPEYWGFTAEDLDTTFSTVALKGPPSMTLRELLAFLDETYARTIGAEYMHVSDERAKAWLQERCEEQRNRAHLDRDTQIFVLERLCAAEEFEDFLQRKFVGAKRFSLEGAEALIPMLWLLLEESARHGVNAVVLGMAHRGRLNALVNLRCKCRRAVFREFADVDAGRLLGRGDVKYHLGCITDITTRHGDAINLTLSFNPSHLEAIDPVVEGIVRAKQDKLGEGAESKVLPVLIHGDAAFIGQGLVAETLNLAGLGGYRTGGTVHIIVNNQIGFTTDWHDSRSSTYCTDIAKMTETPIFHVNGEDPEAVAQVVRIAAEFRQRFARDVIIDMYCFRRYGHNEMDEPRFTQPLTYATVAKHPAVHVVYGRRLAEGGMVTTDEAEAISLRQRTELEAEYDELVQQMDEGTPPITAHQAAEHYVWDADVPPAHTAIDDATFELLAERLGTIPEGFHAHRVLQRLAAERRELASADVTMNWGTAESMAYGSLLLEGHPIRLSGQDTQRGTFSHRHAVLADQRTGATFVPLANLSPDQARFEVFNSPLSEASVLGFEFGYALERPDTLVLWEAQFGDFANGAQVIIDQFISASEDKWEQRAALVMLLPHGYEGQGPEHSSARLERFLQLGGDDNIQVVNLTTPAQCFHAIRRQLHRAYAKPLIVMTPKSLLRHKRAVSTRRDLTEGRFQRVIPETLLADDSAVRRVVLCSGKVYYDLLEYREQVGGNVALVRIEQLYPFPADEIRAAVAPYQHAAERAGTPFDVVWCQEEPRNMGAYTFLLPLMPEALGDEISVQWVTRESSASPATGSAKAHRIEQTALVREAFAR